MLLRTGTGVCYWHRSCIAEKWWLRGFMILICPQFHLPLANDCISTLVKPSKAPPDADHHGWEGSSLRTVNLATVTDPVTGEEIPST